jgi:amino acid adenylation domain-containing protein
MSEWISIDRLRGDRAVAESPRMRQLALAERLRISARGFAPIDASAPAESIPHCFRQTARRFASKVAVRTHQWTLTYADLDALSERVMWWVLAATGGRNVPVALLCGRDAFGIAGILGVLKAGAAYVALDPSFPPKRNRLVLADCGATLLLADPTNRAAAENLAAGADVGVGVIDVDLPAADGAVADPAPGHVAVIVYTSGSTGAPKGVVHNHRTLLATVRRYANALAVGCSDRQLLLSSLAVTASIGNLFSARLSGATLPFDVGERGLGALRSWMQSERATIYHSVASVFRHFCRENRGNLSFPDLRLVRLGRDLAYGSDFQLFRASFPEAVMVDGYGCSEMSSVWHYYLDADSEVPERVVPVGYPSEGVEAYLEPRNSGAEIVLASEYLALGYWRRDDLTARAFGTIGSGRLRTYRTGDMGVLLPDGCLLHAGRADTQVKRNGFRVELAEVKAALRASASVEDAAVVVQSADIGDRRLHAFVIVESEGDVDAVERHLREILPVHMVPDAITAVDQFPWTPNGKLDRAALASWTAPAAEAAAPTEDVEAAIHRIWRDVLESDGFGVDDSFFRVGGTSLHAFRVIGEIERLYGVRTPLKTWIDRPTVCELAARVRGTHTFRSSHPALKSWRYRCTRSSSSTCRSPVARSRRSRLRS